MTDLMSNPRWLRSPGELEPLLRPRSIAVLGASSNPAKLGARLLDNLVRSPFDGDLLAVSPRRESIGDVVTVGDIAECPPVDVALIAIPAAGVPDAVRGCGEAGVRAAILFSSGFAEGGGDGHSLHRDLESAVAQSGMVVCGPNTLGIIDIVRGVPLSFAPDLHEVPRCPGQIAVVSQSGGLGMQVTQLQRRGVGFSWMLAAGNSIDVTSADFVRFLADDDATRAIALVVEGTTGGRRLMEAARIAADAGKPVVCFKLGVTERGAEAALSHTASVAGDMAAFRAACDQSGVLLVDSLDELVETAQLAVKAGRIRGNRVAVVSPSGGGAVMAADAADAAGVEMPEPSTSTRRRLAELSPALAEVRNPIDLTANVLSKPSMYADAVVAVAQDERCDVVVAPMFVTSGPSTADRPLAIIEAAKRAGKPLCSVWISPLREGEGLALLERDPNVAVFGSTQRCMRAIQSLAEWNARPRDLGEPVEIDAESVTALSDACRILGTETDSVPLDEVRSRAVLDAIGIASVPGAFVESAAAARATAVEIGGPHGRVVLKAVVDGVAHKSDLGLVAMGVDPEEAAAAFEDLVQSARDQGLRPRGVLVAQQVVGSVELIVGARRDPSFGPVVVCGLGGLATELLGDHSVRLAPLTTSEAAAMVQSLRSWPLLAGSRGTVPVQLDELAGLIARVGAALVADESIVSLELNPVIVDKGSGRPVPVDALAVVQPGAAS